MKSILPLALTAVVLILPLSTRAEHAAEPFAAELADAHAAFTFGGQPIHPKLISEFEGWMSDGGPVTVTVDVAHAHSANDEYQPSAVTTRDKWVTHHQTTLIGNEDRASEVESSYEYQWIGRLDNGIHVLHTSEWGGGSGHFDGLLWLRFHTDYAVDQYRGVYPRLLLTVVRTQSLGDRSVSGVRIDGDTVWVHPSGRYDEAGNLQIPYDSTQPERRFDWIDPRPMLAAPGPAR